MAASVATFTENAYPNGHAQTVGGPRFRFGSIAISGSGGTYPANGIPVSFVTAGVYTQDAPFYGEAYGVAGYIYVLDFVHGTIRIFEAPTSGPGPLVELSTNSTTPTAVLDDTINCYVIGNLT